MSIGTAKPTLTERQQAPHHFIDSLGVADDYSVGDFERDARSVLDQIFETKQTAVLAGGSGLYIKAVCSGLDTFPPISVETKNLVAAGEQTNGMEWLQAQLSELDPVYFSRIDRQNPARLRRAVEVCLESGRPYSSFLVQDKTPRPFQPVYLLLELPRAELYARIEARVDAMMDAGLETEARTLISWRHRPALRTVGYEEWFDFFDGKISREEAVEKIKQHSRNYAKRQATWFRKHGDWTVFHPDDREGIMAFCTAQLTRNPAQDAPV